MSSRQLSSPSARWIWVLPIGLALGAVIWLWPGGGIDRISIWAAEQQRMVQNALAGAIRGLKTGQPGALLGLMGLCFSYGVFHAAGPGHGKLLIGGYGLGNRVGAWRLSGLALASSLAQSAAAVLLVALGAGLLGLGRAAMTDLADQVLALASYGAIAAVGLWLALRGLRHFRAVGRGHDQGGHDHDHHHSDHAHHAAHSHDHSHDHAHDHDDHHHDEHCGCGHAHGPTPEQVANVHSLSDAILLIGAIAIRPCTGALFLLIITWRMGLIWAGILGTFAMGLGTASITIASALAAVYLRQEGLSKASQMLPNPQTAARAMALVEVAAGLLVALVAGLLLMRGL